LQDENKEHDTGMSTPNNSRQEHPSTYVVQDRSNQEELLRLSLQDQIVTTGMGGVLPEQPDPTRFESVLDVGCGTGGWLIETAKAFPSISQLVGVDVSTKMVEYARAQAEIEHVADRVQFRAMDALRMLEFRAQSFDLVNQRLGASWLRTWDWPKLLSEYQRVCRSEGIVRITESEIILHSNSPALTRLSEIALEAGHQAGLYFTPTADGVTSQLAELLTRSGFQRVQTQLHQLEHRAGTTQGQRFAQDMEQAFRTMLPFLRKWTRLPDNYEMIYQQMLSELHRPDFVAPWRLLTVWGTM
jgi:ubiquinone/menaquinone biosynthesis C-methylase UbiE